MCLTNNFAEETLKDIRKFEKDASSMSLSDLAHLVVQVNMMVKELSDYESRIKDILKENKITTLPVEKYAKQVVLKEGMKKKEYNIPKIYDDCLKSFLETDFFQIINIVKEKVNALNKPELNLILEKNMSIKIGNPYVTIENLKG